ncbi:MAG TPA: TetR family transcriptional regulator, partial [Streptomyces sp.]|nr:TetR family transcriptional regulator [Streptomyces sp.]
MSTGDRGATGGTAGTGTGSSRSARPGGRTARTRHAVRQATLDEIADKGYDGLNVEGVAARSGVH